MGKKGRKINRERKSEGKRDMRRRRKEREILEQDGGRAKEKRGGSEGVEKERETETETETER